MGSFLSRIGEVRQVNGDMEPELRQQVNVNRINTTNEVTPRQNNHSSSSEGDSNPNPQPSVGTSTNANSNVIDARHQPSTSSGKTYHGKVKATTWLPPYQEGICNLRGSDDVVEGERENERNDEQNEDGHEGNDGESKDNNEANLETISAPDAASASQMQNNEANATLPNDEQNGNDNDGGETCSPTRRSKRTIKETSLYEAGPIRAPRRRK